MIDQYKAAANTAIKDVTKSDIYSPGNAMGVKGREDLGGGTAAWFQLEIGVWPSERLETSTVTGNNWGGRNSAIGISSGIGDILLGNWDTPYKQVDFVWNSITSGGFSPGGVIMNMADSTGALNSPLCTNAVNNGTGSVNVTPNNVCATEATAGNTAWSRRISNSVQYWSPVMGGFQFKLMTALATYQAQAGAFPNGVVKPKEYSANATWARGPLQLGIGYDYHEGLRANTAVGGEPNPKDSAVQLAAKFNFGRGEIGAGYEVISYGKTNSTGTETGKMDVPAYVVNGRFGIGPGALWASYSAADAKSCSSPTLIIGSAACGVKPKEYSLGYDYILSKRTKLYVAYNKIDNGTISGTTTGSSYYYIAGPAANNQSPTSGAAGLAQGTDVTTFGLGIQHVF
jgi:predicted porin